jgi:hypothetical protein
MKQNALFLFLILVVGLAFYQFFGKATEGMVTLDSASEKRRIHREHNSHSHFDNYNHYNGTSSMLQNGSTFYGPKGATMVVNSAANGTQLLQVNFSNGDTPVTLQSQPNDSSTFYGENEIKATISHDFSSIEVIFRSGSKITFLAKPENDEMNEYDNQHHQMTSTQYFGSTGVTVPPSSQSSITFPSSAANTQNRYRPEYASALPPGIPRSQIPSGHEDLYILKSEIVPPICPACSPTIYKRHKDEKCPPCPSCQRCPEPQMTCKAIPNYSAMDESFLPQPILSDFSTFGM